MLYCDMNSPLGTLRLIGDGSVLTGILMEGEKHPPAGSADARFDEAPFQSAREQLAAYFAGELREFDLPIEAAGTPFQRRVWRALLDIPYGDTESYGGLARRIGNPNACRAVGLANGRNPIPIIVPCHRVIGSDGSLTGYGGGIERKRWLLAHEARIGAHA